jgi:hypothetical protein
MECARCEKEQDCPSKQRNDEPVMPFDRLIDCRHDDAPFHPKIRALIP